MQNTIFVLTEQRKYDDEQQAAEIIRKAVSAWLTKELSK